MDRLEEWIRQLAKERAYVAEHRQCIEEIEAEISASPLGQALERERQYLETAKEGAAMLEQDIRSLAVTIFAADGDKRPHPAVGIREMTRVEYDERLARAYCQHRLPDALRLDATVFEKVIRSLDEPPKFVTVYKEPTATIARDLEV
jgi:hypothetical protein